MLRGRAGDQLLHIGEFGQEFHAVFLEGFIQWQCKALRDCAEPQGGDFRGSAISEKLLGFYGFLE